MRSPSRSSAIGPPRAASGAMWPTMKPCVAPLKRPSVISATSSPRPRPISAAVTPSISRMPGPPAGPSLRITMTSPACDRAGLHRGERVFLALEHARAAFEVRRALAGQLQDAAFRREVAVQDRIAAARLERLRDRMHHVLRFGARRGGRASANRLRPVTVGASSSMPAAISSLRDRARCRRRRTARPRCSGRRASGRRSPACAPRPARNPRASTSTPASRAIASRCSTALVEPAVAATMRAALRNAVAREHVARRAVVAQAFHHQLAAAVRGRAPWPDAVAGMSLQPIGDRPSVVSTIAIVLAVNWPPQAPAPGQASRSTAVSSLVVDLARAVRADRLEHLLDRDRMVVVACRARCCRRTAPRRGCSAAPAPSPRPEWSCRSRTAPPSRRGSGRPPPARSSRRSPRG